MLGFLLDAIIRLTVSTSRHIESLVETAAKKITWWLTFCAGEVLQGIADDRGQAAEEKGKASCSVGRREYWGTNRIRGNFKMASESGWELATCTKREGNGPERVLRIC